MIIVAFGAANIPEPIPLSKVSSANPQ